MDRVYFISKSPLSGFPRLVSIPLAIAEAGFHVVIWAPGQLPPALAGKSNIEFQALELPGRAWGRMSKILTWVSYRWQVSSRLKEIPLPSLIWLSSADAAIPLRGNLDGRRTVLQINELYDEHPIYLRVLKKISQQSAVVVVPEQNRAHILKVWLKLRSIPFILPNVSPYDSVETCYEEHLERGIKEIEGRKQQGKYILLYQGHIGPDRDFSELVRVLGDLTFKIHLVLLGKDHGMVAKYRKIYKRITWIPYLQPPQHLSITALADIGIVYYTPNSLNNIFCAPNKVWEYARFGAPTISNTIPGMLDYTMKYKSGISCDFDSPKDIKQSLRRLIEEKEVYSLNARRMYEAVDYVGTIRQILNHAAE